MTKIRHFRRLGIAAIVGAMGLAAVPISSQAAPTSAGAVHYIIQENATCNCFVTANVNLFPGGADDSVTQVALPFPVYVYGAKHTTAWVSSNGNVQFAGPGETTFSNTPLPSSFLSPKAAVAPLWDDLIVNGAGSGTGVFSKHLGNEYIISWRGYEFNNPLNAVRAEVIFYKNSRLITFNYISALPGDGASATIGVQKSATGAFTQWSFNSPGSAPPGLQLNFVPVG